jgi:hypothetical protein
MKRFLFKTLFICIVVVAVISLISTMLDFDAMFVDLGTLISETIKNGLVYGLVLFIFVLPLLITFKTSRLESFGAKSTIILATILLGAGIIGLVLGWLAGAAYYQMANESPSYGVEFEGIMESLVGAGIGYATLIVTAFLGYKKLSLKK